MILVVDDEELMREIAKLIIEESGKTVLVACDGQEGVDLYRANMANIKAVFLDFSMPKLNGYETYVEMKKLNPDVKVLMASGLKPTKEVSDLVERGEIKFLSKPFQESQLVKVLEEIYE